MSRAKNTQVTPPVDPTAPATDTPDAPRKRRSEVERTAIAVEHAIDALKLVGTRVQSWHDGSTDEDTRVTFKLVGETITIAHTMLGKNEIAKLIRDNAPKSARVVDYEVGMLVKVREKYRNGFADAVEGNVTLLDDLIVFSVKPAMVGVRATDGTKIFALRTQLIPADLAEGATDDADDATDTTEDTKVA